MKDRQILSAYDVDGVLIDFLTSFIAKAKEVLRPDLFAKWPQSPEEWTSWLPVPPEEFVIVWDAINNCQTCKFWQNLNVHPKLNVAASSITPDFYLTSIPCHSWERSFNLAKLGFPDAPIIAADNHDHKADLIYKYGITHVIEDRYENWVSINRDTDAECFLIVRPHNISQWSRNDQNECGAWFHDNVIQEVSEYESVVSFARSGF